MSGNIFARLDNQNDVMYPDSADNERAAHRQPRLLSAADTSGERWDRDYLDDTFDLGSDVLTLDVTD